MMASQPDYLREKLLDCTKSLVLLGCCSLGVVLGNMLENRLGMDVFLLFPLAGGFVGTSLGSYLLR